MAYKIALLSEQLCIEPINTEYCYEETIYLYGLNYQISKYGMQHHFYEEALRALIRITTKPFFSKELVDHVLESLLLLAQKNILDHISSEAIEHLIDYVQSNECTKVFIRNELIEKLAALKNKSKSII